VDDYVVEAITDSMGMDNVILHVLAKDTSIEQELKIQFQSSLRVVPEIKLIDKKTLDEFQLSGESRKVKRFLDNR
jgi:hypothetical protein